MPDIFDQIQPDGAATPALPPATRSAPLAAKGDIFDQIAPDSGTMDASPSDRLLTPEQVKKQFFGVKYKYGADSCTASDCSSFARQLYQRNGVPNLPRTAHDQWMAPNGQQIKSFKDIQPGDQLFFHGTNGHGPGVASHTGYYLGVDAKTGARQFVHNSSSKGGVVISNLDAYPLAQLGAKRYPQIDAVVKARQAQGQDAQTPHRITSRTMTTPYAGEPIVAPASTPGIDPLIAGMPQSFRSGNRPTVRGKLSEQIQQQKNDLGIGDRSTELIKKGGIAAHVINAQQDVSMHEYMRNIGSVGGVAHFIDRAAGSLASGENIEQAPGLLGGMVDRGFGAGAANEVQNVASPLGQIAYNVLDAVSAPSNLVLGKMVKMKGASVLEKAAARGASPQELAALEKAFHRTIAGVFAAPAGTEAAKDLSHGDYDKAFVQLATLGAIMGAHPIIKKALDLAMPVDEAVRSLPREEQAQLARSAKQQINATKEQLQARTVPRGKKPAPAPQEAAPAVAQPSAPVGDVFDQLQLDNDNSVHTPSRLYHGTTKEFDAPDANRSKKNPIFWLAENEDYAKVFASQDHERNGSGPTSRVIHYDLSPDAKIADPARNPEHAKDVMEWADTHLPWEIDENGTKWLPPEQAHKNFDPHYTEGQWDNLTHDDLRRLVDRGDFRVMESRGLTEYLKAKGYHGVASIEDGRTVGIYDPAKHLTQVLPGHPDAPVTPAPVADMPTKPETVRTLPGNADVPAEKPQVARPIPQAEPPAEPIVTPAEGRPATEPTAGVAKTPAPDTSGVTSPKNEFTEAERAARGLPPVERQEYKMGEDVVKAGHEWKAKPGNDASALAKDVAEKPRVLSVEEVGALGIERARLKLLHKSMLDTIEKSIDAGDTNTAVKHTAQLRAVEDALDMNDQALVKGGREQSAAFRARQIGIDEQYEYANIRKRLLASDPNKPLTPAESDRVANLSRQLDAAEKAIREHETNTKTQAERIKELEAQQSIRRKVSAEAKEARKQTRSETKAGLLKERDALVQEWRKKTGKASAGVDPELAVIAAKLARNAIKRGIVSADGVVNDVWNSVKDHVAEGVEKRHIRDAISGYGQKNGAPTKNEAVSRLNEAKRQMRLISAIEDANAGKVPEKGARPGEPSPAVQKLRVRLNKAMDKNGLSPPRAPRVVTEASRVATRKTRLTRQIDDLQKQVDANKANDAKAKPAPAGEKELAPLVKKVATLKAKVEALKPPATLDEATKQNAYKKRAKAQIANLNRQVKDLKAGKAPEAKPEPLKLSPENEKLSKRIDTLRKQRDALKPPTVRSARNPSVRTDAQKNAAIRTQLSKEIADLDRRIEQKDFTPRTGSKSVPLEAETQTLKAQRDALRKTYDELDLGKDDRNAAARLKATKARLGKDIEELERREREGDYSPFPKRKPSVYDAEAEALKSKRDAIRQRIEQEIEKRRPKSIAEKGLALHREFILSGISVFEKLFGASLSHVPVEAASNVFGAMAGQLRVKGKSLASVAGVEGQLSPRAEVTGVRSMLSREAVKNAVESIRTGMNAIHTMAGGKPHGNELGGYMGRLHGAEKSFLQTGAFRKAIELRVKRAASQGLDVTNTDVQAQIGLEAAIDAQRAILQNDNHLARAMNNGIGTLQRSESAGVRNLGHFFRSLVPITKVAANYVGRAADMTGIGLLRGTGMLIKEARSTEPMPRETADAIIRAYKYGGMGLVAAYIGYQQPSWFKSAGYFAKGTPGNKDTDGKAMEPGELQIAGMHVPHVMAHNPFFEAVQFWATITRGFDNAKIGGGRGVAQAVSGLALQAPGMESSARVLGALKDDRSFGKVSGEYVRGLTEPQLLQQTAAYRDTKDGKAIKRTPRGFTDALKVGIPGLREQVPMSKGQGVPLKK